MGDFNTIVYMPVVWDLFHFGHLNALHLARKHSEYTVAGLMTNEVVMSYKRPPIASFEERKAVAEVLRVVDEVMVQDEKDPTANLKILHARFPEAKIILLYGSQWKLTPGKEYLEEIGGEIMINPYYSKLSDYKIMEELVKRYKEGSRTFEDFTSYFHVPGMKTPLRQVKDAIVSTKANTLRTLAPLLNKSTIEPSFVFTVREWNQNKPQIVSNILELFQNQIIVRSSTLDEDTLTLSNAGMFHSELNVNPARTDLEQAIEKVIQSYAQKGSTSQTNQVLVQLQTQNIANCGVIFTRAMETNAPYYEINYDDTTGLSDTVTSGMGGKTVRITKTCPPNLIPQKFTKLLEAVKEIENIIPQMSLDIEFAVKNNGDIVIFQVRPIAVNRELSTEQDKAVFQQLQILKQHFVEHSKPHPEVEGDLNLFGDMPDWNPAEILGAHPSYLDYSLYDHIITGDIWSKARATQTYNDVGARPLVILFGNKPYINVRNTFNSFIPASVPKELRRKLMHFYLNKLKKNPHLQDKVEFEVLFTCYDFDFDERARELQENGFTHEEISTLKNSLIELTNTLILNNESIDTDLAAADILENRRNEITFQNPQTPQEYTRLARSLLEDCKRYGTLQFSRLARLAFVGKILLKSLTKKGMLPPESYEDFFGSMSTVATQLNDDFQALASGSLDENTFYKRYGHLRPGTYDITSLRYDDQKNLFSTNVPLAPSEKAIFNKSPDLISNIDAQLQNAGLKCTAEQLLAFTEKAVVAREFSKFEFTKNLSLAMEYIAKAGSLLELPREECAYLDVDTIFHYSQSSNTEMAEQWKATIKLRKEQRDLNENIYLPDIIRSEQDFFVVENYIAKPNFITKKSITGEIIDLDKAEGVPELKGKIVLIENGDPGYDWIFTKEPLGLITKFGGVASHMAIRCAEFGIPAAIGAGSELYDKVRREPKILLDCQAQKIQTVGEP
ncbi:MAG: PEP-utilizing enzyme [Candidatus Nanoarchaeia archaeon]